MWCITLIDLQILKNLCIPEINPTWSWCMIFMELQIPGSLPQTISSESLKAWSRHFFFKPPWMILIYSPSWEPQIQPWYLACCLYKCFFFFFLIKKEVITHFIFLISSCLPAQAPLLHTKFDKVISLHDRSFSRACVTAAFLHLFIQFIHYCLILPLEFQEKEPGSDFCPPLYKQCPT